MNIRKWLGLVSAVSPYALPGGATVEQNNLQIRNPGQLVPRPGLIALNTQRNGEVRALHRQSPGGSTPDRLIRFDVADFNEDTDKYSYAMYVLRESNSTLTPTEILRFDDPNSLYPSMAQDRHGAVYVFFGNGIKPRRYLDGIDTVAIDLGMPAPSVAPQVSPFGDGWFIERVDVLSTGTSYYTPPRLTVSGGSPDRNATVRAVVQGGAIVAVDVIDGGSNFKGVPTITVSDEQIGTGFLAAGTRTTTPAVYGFKDTTAVSAGYPTGSLTAGNTHSFDLSVSSPTIAYKTFFGATGSVSATYNRATGQYTALIPLNPVTGSGVAGARAQVTFNPISAAFRLGDAAVSYAYGSEVSSTSGTQFRFRVHRAGWYDANDYFENTYEPANANFTDLKVYQYHWQMNRDAFWGLMPYPHHKRFAKRQLVSRFWKDSTFTNRSEFQQYYGDYYFPDYNYVGYRILVGPENGLAVESNWNVGFAPVQYTNNRPYIDIRLFPAKTTTGRSRTINNNSRYPLIRIYLAPCPDAWLVNNTAPLNSGEAYNRRYTPQSGWDRRALATDTTNGRTTNTPSGNMTAYEQTTNITSQTLSTISNNKRWWGQGHVFGNAQARPIVDTRVASNSDAIGLGGGTVELLDAGAQLEQGTKFVVRLEQHNAAAYTVGTGAQDPNDATTFYWLNSLPTTPYIPADATTIERRGAFNSQYIDFYFEANVLDSAGGDPALLLPGAVASNPTVAVGGTGWANGQQAFITLQQRTTTPTGSPVYTDSVTYRWNTELITPAVTGDTIGTISIVSQGVNYFREPTILYRGGGGYGLKTQATVSGGKVTNVVLTDGGDGFTSDTILYTDVQPAKLLPILRGTMRGTYRCAYRYADYRQTVVRSTTVTGASGDTQVTLASTAGVKPGMKISMVGNAAGVTHLTTILSVADNLVTLSTPLNATVTAASCVVRDMTRPIAYSDFSPITDIEANANGSGRASTLQWTLVGATAPARAEYVELFRTSADQSLVFYRLEHYGIVTGNSVTLVGTDGLSDEELFDVDRPGYAALPVVLPNGGLNAFRFGQARSDMSVCVAWQDRLWYGVSTSGNDGNTVFYSEYDEFESCPDLNELPIQSNLRSSDYLTALVPFGPVLLAMQNSHTYSISYATDPSVDPAITLTSHRGCFNQRTWDIFDDVLYAADERGVYSTTKAGEITPLSEAIRDYFTDNKLDLAQRPSFFLRVDQQTGILRLFVCLVGSSAVTPHIAFCYHIANKAWWTETWPNSLTCACDYRATGEREVVIYGSTDSAIYKFGGARDYPNSDIVSVTVTNGGSGYVSPPTVTLSSAAGGAGAELQPIIYNGVVTEVLVKRGGFGYGTISSTEAFNPTVALTFSAPPSGVTATGFATARSPNLGTATSPVWPRTSVPFSVRTGNLELSYEGNARNGDRLMNRSVSVAYRPTTSSKTLNLREYYNNSSSPRPNVMRRDRGTGFVHQTDGVKTTLDMVASRSALGLATGIANAMFAGRSLDDTAATDRHIAVELSCDAVAADNAEPPEALIYHMEVRGVEDGGE